MASVGISVVVTSLLTLIVSCSTGFNKISTFSILISWTILLSLIAGHRRFKLARNQPLVPVNAIKDHFKSKFNRWELTQSFLLLVLLFSVARLLVASSSTKPQFTEFYIMGPDRLAGNLPERVKVGQSLSLFVGIANHEGHRADYQIHYQIEGNPNHLLKAISLNDQDIWEKKVAFPRFNDIGRHKITLTLHQASDPSPYRTVHFWIKVTNPNTSSLTYAASALQTHLATLPNPLTPKLTPPRPRSWATGSSPPKAVSTAGTTPPCLPLSPEFNITPATITRSLELAAIVILLILLILKELLTASGGGRFEKLDHLLNFGISGLLIVFTLIVIGRMIAVLR